MDIVSVGFIALMVVISGVVAFIADRIGRKLGKKRLTFLGMRPRKTATFFTVLAGSAIALITIAMVAVFSEPVRRWILEGNQAIEDAKNLRSQRESLTTEVSGLQGQLSSVEGQRLTAIREAKSAEERRVLLDRQVKQLDIRVADFRRRVASLETQYRSTNDRLRAKEGELLQKIKALNIAEADRKEIDRLFRELRRQRDEAFEDLGKVQDEIEVNERTIRDQLQQISGLNASKSQLEKDYAAQQRSLEEKQRELDNLNQQLKDGEEELARVSQGIQALLKMNEGTRTRPILYNARDEVSRLVVPADLTMTQARNNLNSLLRSSRIAAEALGAKGSSRVPAAAIFADDPEVQTGRIVAEISGVAESRILVAIAHWNSFAGEPVPLDIISYPNKLCFKENEVIGETRIDGDLPAGEVIRLLTNWLAGEVRAAALKAGMVPVAGRSDSLANVAPEQVFDLVAQIKSQSRTARVQAVAATDTYASSPLQLTFRIR